MHSHQDIEDAYSAEMDRLRDQWFAEHPDGAFKAYRLKTPDDLRPKRKPGPGGGKGRKKKQKLEAGNMADVDGTTFVVFNIFAHPSSGNLVAAFYEAGALELEEGLTCQHLRDLDTSHEADLCARSPECVSIGDYEEVMDWVRNSDAVDPRFHIPNLSPTLAEVEHTPTTKKRKQGGSKAIKSNRIADVPGVELVGRAFVDPEVPGETSLGLCIVYARPKKNARSTARTFYKQYQYYTNYRKQPEQPTTTEVAAWVLESEKAVAGAVRCFHGPGRFLRSVRYSFNHWWRKYVLEYAGADDDEDEGGQ